MPYADKKEQKDAQRRHYEKYKTSYLDRAANRRKRILDIVNPQKENPCTDCKKTYPYYVMDFDHREDEIKIAEINTLIRNSGRIEEIQAEIKKCDLVCANCHRIRTHNRGYKNQTSP